MVKKLGREAADIIELRHRLNYWKTKEVEKAKTAEQWKKAEAITDRADSLKVIISNLAPSGTIDSLLAEIERLFTKKTDKVTLSTIHGAKGLEWPEVFFLEADKIPTIWTLKAVEHSPEKCAWMLQEEENLRYVAITRAQHTLSYIKLEGWECDSD